MKKQEEVKKEQEEEEEGCPSPRQAGGTALGVGPRGQEHPGVGAAVGKDAGFSLAIRAKKARHTEGSKKGS